LLDTSAEEAIILNRSKAVICATIGSIQNLENSHARAGNRTDREPAGEGAGQGRSTPALSGMRMRQGAGGPPGSPAQQVEFTSRSIQFADFLTLDLDRFKSNGDQYASRQLSLRRDLPRLLGDPVVIEGQAFEKARGNPAAAAPSFNFPQNKPARLRPNRLDCDMVRRNIPRVGKTCQQQGRIAPWMDSSSSRSSVSLPAETPRT
jgi:hypothetical protein